MEVNFFDELLQVAEKGNEPRPSRVHNRADDEPNPQPTSSATQEYPSLIDTFFVAHNVNEEFLRDEDQRIYEKIRRLEATGTYTDDEINRLARGDMFSQFESGGASESGGCGDDEESADDLDDDDEDGDGDS
nr:hypothetical protein [Tanacetum cinerariifolium]